MLVLEKADDSGYQISSHEFDILQQTSKATDFALSAKLFGAKAHNPQYFPKLYLTNEDYNRIYNNIVGIVLTCSSGKYDK